MNLTLQKLINKYLLAKKNFNHTKINKNIIKNNITKLDFLD